MTEFLGLIWYKYTAPGLELIGMQYMDVLRQDSQIPFMNTALATYY